jgi:hypothetical protein
VAAVPPRRCWTADRTRCPTRIRLRYSPPVKPLSRGRAAPTRRRRSLPNDEFCPPSRASRRILPDPAQGLYARQATGFPRIDDCENTSQLLLVMLDAQHRVTPSAVHQSRPLGCTVDSFTSADLWPTGKRTALPLTVVGTPALSLTIRRERPVSASRPAQRQPAAVLKLVRSDSRDESCAAHHHSGGARRSFPRTFR